MIRLLIVDDSPLIRRLLTAVFTQHGGFEVETARSGEDALAKLKIFAPDVVTLDITMPGMSGLECLDRIMIERPCPVVMVSSLTTEGARETLEALALGAVAFVPKPRGAVSIELEAASEELVATVLAAARVTISRTARLVDRIRRLRETRANVRPAARPSERPRPYRQPSESAPSESAPSGAARLVLIGCSTGGPPALDAVLGGLSASFAAPIVIAQHMPANFTGPLAQRLDRLCAIDVSEVTRPTIIEPGHAYVGRGDADILITRRQGALAAMPAPSSANHHWHPSVDRLVDSALRIVPPESLVGVLMTGMGSDGADAMAQMRARGGRTIAESEETALIWGMPGALIAAGGAEFVEPLEKISSRLAGFFQ